MRTKDEVVGNFKKFKALAENKIGKKIKVFCSKMEERNIQIIQCIL